MNWAQVFVAIVGLLREGFPFPDFTIEGETSNWLERCNPHLAKLITLIALAVQTEGTVSAPDIAEGIRLEAERQNVEIDMSVIMKIVEFVVWLIGLFTGTGSPSTEG